MRDRICLFFSQAPGRGKPARVWTPPTVKEHTPTLSLTPVCRKSLLSSFKPKQIVCHSLPSLHLCIPIFCHTKTLRMKGPKKQPPAFLLFPVTQDNFFVSLEAWRQSTVSHTCKAVYHTVVIKKFYARTWCTNS